jgi:hypothetical protein
VFSWSSKKALKPSILLMCLSSRLKYGIAPGDTFPEAILCK